MDRRRINSAKRMLESNGYYVIEEGKVGDFIKGMKDKRDQSKKNKEVANLITKIESSSDPLNTAFAELVPSQGKADTVAGELVRAIMRIMYRDFNDGDVFYAGYGMETCGSSVGYICNEIPELEEKFELIANKQSEGSEYTRGLEDISKSLMDFLSTHKDLYSTQNTGDSSLDIDGKDFIKMMGWAPDLELEVYLPDSLMAHVEEGNVTVRDIVGEMSYWDYIRDYDIKEYYGNIVITGIDDPDAYDELDRDLPDWLAQYAEELDNEFGVPGDEDYEDEEEDW